MRTLVEQPAREQLKSFDLSANVNLLRFDLENFGHVLPETRQRVGDEQLSHMVEGCDRASCTQFVFRRESDDLLHFDKGEWRRYGEMTERGLEVAELEALDDSRRLFFVDWARDDQVQYGRMRELRPGEQHYWFRSFPHGEKGHSGAAFLQECGLQPEREMGFLYRASCRDDGFIVLESQTVDRSDEDAFAAAMQIGRDNPAAILNELRAAYDRKLMQKRGGYFYAGRRNSERNENAWEQLLKSRDLIEYLLDGLEDIARRLLPPLEQEQLTKKHVYGVWALFKRRLDGEAITPQNLAPAGSVAYEAHRIWLAREVHRSYREFVAHGRVLIGCGGAITILAGEAEILNASSDDVFSAIFGSRETSGATGEACVYAHDGCYCCGLNDDGTPRPSKMKVWARRDEHGVAHCLREHCNAWLSSDGKDGYIGDIAKKAEARKAQSRAQGDYELKV